MKRTHRYLLAGFVVVTSLAGCGLFYPIPVIAPVVTVTEIWSTPKLASVRIEVDLNIEAKEAYGRYEVQIYRRFYYSYSSGIPWDADERLLPTNYTLGAFAAVDHFKWDRSSEDESGYNPVAGDEIEVIYRVYIEWIPSYWFEDYGSYIVDQAILLTVPNNV